VFNCGFDVVQIQQLVNALFAKHSRAGIMTEQETFFVKEEGFRLTLL